MKDAIHYMRLLQGQARAMDRLFRIADLSILLQAEGKSLHDRINSLVDYQLLFPVCRGLYGTEGWTLESASARLYPGSFISGPTMLAEYLMIGTISSQRLFCVKTGLPRRIDTPLGELHFHSTQERLLFGYTRHGFVNKADPERALLDTLYYHLRGEYYFFDIYSDIHVGDLDADRFAHYVDEFRNPKFKAFAHDYYRSRSQDH